MQKVDSKHSFAKLRQEALLTFKQAWSQPGGRPCEGPIATMLLADLTGSKAAAQPADTNGLLKIIWDWTKACWGTTTKSASGNAALPAIVAYYAILCFGHAILPVNVVSRCVQIIEHAQLAATSPLFPLHGSCYYTTCTA